MGAGEVMGRIVSYGSSSGDCNSAAHCGDIMEQGRREGIGDGGYAQRQDKEDKYIWVI